MLVLLVPLLKILLVLMLVWTIFSYFLGKKHTFQIVHSRWHHTFEEMLLSPKEFYAEVTDEINKKEVPGIQLDMVTHTQARMFSPSRLYLQIKRGDHLILICAAPFGTEYFVSWWFGEAQNSFDDFIRRIPYIGKHIEEYMNKRTFYQLDTNDMFKDMIKHCVMGVIDRMATEKGYRLLDDHQRNTTDRPVALKLL